jgi:hypothetical protein
MGEFEFWLLQGLKPDADSIGFIGTTKSLTVYG